MLFKLMLFTCYSYYPGFLCFLYFWSLSDRGIPKNIPRNSQKILGTRKRFNPLYDPGHLALCSSSAV